jgi:hypothetical protein
MDTHPPRILSRSLDFAIRERMLAGIRNAIDTGFAGKITMTYLSLLALARRKE